MLEVHRHSSIEWNPSSVLALATSVDDSQVAAAREDGSLEIWLVSPGSIGWHCQLTIHGDPKSRVSSLVWCRPGSNDPPSGRLFSSSIDGSVSEWDLFNLNQKNALDSIGVSIWQMALEPYSYPLPPTGEESHSLANGYLNDKHYNTDDPETSESEDDTDSVEFKKQPSSKSQSLALACDDGCIRIYTVTDSDELSFNKSLPRVTGRILSVAWSHDAKLIYSGSSDGFIRCWDVKLSFEVYRITAGRGGPGPKTELCIWSLLVLRSRTIVSADSSGSVQFWDSEHGTLLQAHSLHKGDVYALAAAPNQNRVFSAGSDGQVIIYKHSGNKSKSGDDTSALIATKQWIYIGYVRAHTHDVRALTMAVPNHQEDPLPVEKVKRVRQKKKPIDFSYRKWAHLGVPMLISAGDDTKLYAYSAMDFTSFSPHDICPVPQRVPIQLVHTVGLESSLLLVQAPYWLDILSLHTKNRATHVASSGNIATTNLLARVKSKESMKIICSSISASGVSFAYSNHIESRLFELKGSGDGQNLWSINKKKLPRKLPFAHSMVFSSDSSRLMISGHDRKIYVVDVSTSKLLHSFTPIRDHHHNDSSQPIEPPITRLFCSSDGQWLAAINCFGDIYIFNLEIQRQHWFISRFNGAAVTAAGFPPQNSNVFIISTSSNQVYAFDVEARQLGEWSRRNTFVLPRRYQDFPGEVLGLSFLPASTSSRVVIYSARAMCCIDFGMDVDENEDDTSKNNPPLALNGSLKRKSKEKKAMGRRKNFEFCGFRDPVLFVGHLWKNSVLVIDKPWIDVVRSFDTAPVHRHIFGT